jgi:ligand-binding sensor domain-containing protein
MKKVLFILWLSCYANAYAQDVWKEFKNLENLEVTNSICKDKKGNMWVAGINSIHKYDGSSWMHYPIEGCYNHPVYINQIFSDDTSIWVCTNGYWVSKFSNNTWISYRWSFNSTINFNNVYSMCFDSPNNTYWFATELGVVKFKNNIFELVFKLIPEVRHLKTDRNNNVWFANGNIGKINNNNSIEYIDTLHKFINTGWPTNIVFDKGNNMYINNVNNELLKYNGVDFERISVQADGLTYRNSVLLLDSKENIWIGTDNAGIIKYNGTSFENFNYVNNKFINHPIMTIAEDNKQQIWVGTYKTNAIKQTLKEDPYGYCKIIHGRLSTKL